MYSELNQKIAEELGYTVRTQEAGEGYPGASVIVSPDGLDLWYTERSSAHYKDEKITIETLCRGSWRDLFDPDKQDGAEESEWDEIPPDWSHDATAAMQLFERMEKPEEFWLSVEYVYVSTILEWRYHCNVYLADWLTGIRGIDSFLATAISEAWLTYKRLQPVKPN